MFFTNIVGNISLEKLFRHRTFKVAYRFESIADDAVAYMHFSNPSLAQSSSIITLIEVVSQGQGKIDIADSFTVDVAGTDVTPLNLFLGSTYTPTASVKQGGTYSGITNKLSYTAPGGTSVRAVGASNSMAELILVPPGKELLIQFTNTAGVTNDCSIAIVWVETL